MPPKPIDVNPIINMAAKMDVRTNNEVMDIAPNDVGMELFYLQNGDLFFTKSLTVRQGVVVLGGVQSTSGSANLWNLQDNLVSGTTFSTVPQLSAFDDLTNYGLTIIQSGNTNVYSGNMHIRGAENTSTTITSEYLYDMNVQMLLYEVNNFAAPASGASYMFQPSPSGNIYHNIALSGNYNAPPYPQLNGQFAVTPSPTNGLPIPLAFSNTNYYNFGAYTTPSGSTKQYTTMANIPFKFEAPYQLHSGSVYFLMPIIQKTSGSTFRRFDVAITVNSGTDIYPNLTLGEDFFSPVPPSPFPGPYQMWAISGSAANKSWLETHSYSYVTPSYVIADNPTAKFDMPTQIVSGTQPINRLTYYQEALQSPPIFNGAVSVPNVSTEAVEFGQVFNFPSGTNKTINGAYFFATPNDEPDWNAYSRSKAKISGANYTVGYSVFFSEIARSSGSIAAGNYQILNRNIIGQYSGTYTFDPLKTDTYTASNSAFLIKPTITPPAVNNLNKIYAIFQNPPHIAVNSGTNYLLSVKFFDAVTGGPFTDYAYQNVPSFITGQSTDFRSFMEVGFENSVPNSSGTYVCDYRNNGIFISPSGDSAIYSDPKSDSLTCGLLGFASGTAITSIYDYRVGDSRSQRVMFTQGSNLSYFTLDNTAARVPIYSGLAIGDNFKVNHSTFQNLLFTSDYSQTSGVCWDQIYTNPSGNWTQLHGLRPVFSGVGVRFSGATPFPQSGTGITMASGDFINVMIGTSILSGGIRSSEILTISGSSISSSGISNFPSGSNSIQLFGVQSSSNDATYPYDIYHVSGVSASGQSQYKFDVFSNGTYVFSTQPSGQGIFYLAPLCDSRGNPYPNPMPNNNTWNLVAPFYSGANTTPGSGVFMYDVRYSGINAQQVPNVVNYSQVYLQNQVNTPKFKKTIVWNNILFGIGDPEFPSRIWFSQIGAPQIWGDVGDINYGFYDVDPDNGQVITGIESYKGYLIIFKENSTYAGQYTSTAGNPLSIQKIDNNKGNLGIFSTVSTAYGVFGLSQYGPVLATYYGCETIGDEILPYFQDLSHQDLIYSVAVHDVARQQIYWSITNSNVSQDNQTGLVYSYALKAWGVRKNGMWNAAGTVGDEDNFSLLLIGDTIGQIKLMNSNQYTDDEVFVDNTGNALGQPVQLSFETPWMNFGGNSQILKQAKSLRVNCNESDQTLRIDVYYDQNISAPVYSRFLDMSQPVWNRVVSLSGVFRTVKFVVTALGSGDQVKINSLQLTYMNRGQNTNIN